jgi:predicted RNA-binding protein associated with RNAse of E/G family
VAQRTRTGLALFTTFDLPDLPVGPTTFRRGDVFVEFYDWRRWFVVAQLFTPAGVPKGWYCDVTMPPTIVPDADGAAQGPVRWCLTYVDLDLDLWQHADGTVTLLDEDEYAASLAAGAFTETQRRGAEQGWRQLRALAEAHALPRWPGWPHRPASD